MGFILMAPSLQAQKNYHVPRLPVELNFDGIPDEAAWQIIDELPLHVLAPVFGAEPSEKTSLKIAYDDIYLYVGGFFYYDDPGDMRAVGKKRDYDMPTTDWLGVILDTYFDRENTVMFWTNPNGVRSEGTTKNDMADPINDYNFSWNTFWDVATSINDSGWSTEMRIPFSSLRFQTKENETVMGLTFVRYIPTAGEWLTFPVISPEIAFSHMKASQTAPVILEGIRPKKTVYITPYVTGGMGQTNDLNEGGTGYKMSTKAKFDAGLDLKYSLTSNLTLDLTVNTDFAQVEADDQKINLTRFSLWFPEKRVFFLEKSDVFDFSFLGGNNLFYSRRIGLSEGHPVRIYGGARLTGRVNKWDLGIMDMQTAAFEEKPGENFGVIRAKRSILNTNSYLGTMVTSRLGTDGSYNMAYGLDGQLKVIGDEYLTVRWAQSFENDSVNRIFDWSPSRLMLNWARRRQQGFAYDLVYTWSGDQFNPGIGFELKDNYHGWRTITQYGWLPGEEASLRYHKIMLTAYTFWNTATRLRETVNGMMTWSFEGKSGNSGNANINWFLEDIRDTLTLGNDQASVLPGRYSFAYISAAYNTNYAHALSASLTAEAGRFYDGTKISLYAAPTINIGTDIDLGLTYYFDFVNFPGRNSRFVNHIAGLKGLWTFTTKTSLIAFIQYNTAIDRVVSNLRFRYNPREGNDFYLVWDEGLNSDPTREIPRLPLTSGRTILLKYTYTFRF
ncbi:MAG: DUF5916 domain-containing protein [Bacteroidales bacterium]|nr:DUF5916 domain-containing protein [Bacteroidales bacterium]MDT8374802.1 DUF5916 domain-containing protein [Bacteroidales bacterium]